MEQKTSTLLAFNLSSEAETTAVVKSSRWMGTVEQSRIAKVPARTDKTNESKVKFLKVKLLI